MNERVWGKPFFKMSSFHVPILGLTCILRYEKCRNMVCIWFLCMCYVLSLGPNLNLYILTSCRLHSGQCKDQLVMHLCVCAASFFICISDKEQLLLTRYVFQHTYVPVVPEPCTERSSKKGGGNWGLPRINKNMPIKHKGLHARFLCTYGHWTSFCTFLQSHMLQNLLVINTNIFFM